MRLLLLVYCAVCCFGSLSSYGQHGPSSASAAQTLLPQRVPPTPTTAALERYALMPVNEPAGTPTISIPLYEVRCGQLTLPITVSYHAAGIRVADAASWVGLGWSLNAGGVITHIVNGMPDEVTEGFREHPDQIPHGDTLQAPAHYLRNLGFLDRVSSHQLDYLPDLYTFSLGSQAGTFMQGNDGRYQLLPRQPVHIATTDTAFQLTDAHGVQYFFNSKEYITLLPRASDDRHYTSAWYLNRIVSADRADTIRLEYTPYRAETTAIQQQQTFPLSASDPAHVEEQMPGLLGPGRFTQTTTRTVHLGLRLRRIVFRTGMVELATTQDRRDTPWDSRLRTLTVLSRDRRDTLRQVRFYQSYFPRVGPDLPPQGPADSTRYAHYALRLDSLQTSTTGQSVPPYRFTYNTSAPLTTAIGGSRDHWGYHNGATPAYIFYDNQSTPNLLPAGTVPAFPRSPVSYPGADRRPNPAFVQAGILTGIRYPTGGGQRFVYEPNTIPGTCTIPNPSTMVRLAASAPDTLGAFAIKQRIFSLSGPVRVTYCRIIINSPRVGTGHGTGSISLWDITSSDSTMVGQWDGPANPSVVLAAGHTYRITIRVREASSAFFELQYESAITATKPCPVLTGGLRLREEQLQANAQAPVTYRRYSYTNPATQASSGYLIRNASPLYSRVKTTVYTEKPSNPTQWGDYGTITKTQHTVDYLALSNSSLWDVAGGDRIVGYTCVSVVDSAATGQMLGRTVSYYVGAGDVLPQWGPALPGSSNSWRRDQLLTQLVYAQSTDAAGAGTTPATGILRSRLDNTYAERDTLAIRGFSAAPDVSIGSNGLVREALIQLNLKAYAWGDFRQYSGWKYLTRTRRYLYPPSGDTTAYQLTTTTYRYDNATHQQPTLVETSLADGQRQQVRSRYVGDYDPAQAGSTSPAARALGELARLHAVADVVEQTTTRTTATDTLVTASNITLSRVLAPGVVVPARQLGLLLAQPLPWRTFQAAQLRAGQLLTDAHYEPRVVFDAYDAQRQLAQAHLPGGTRLSYLWDTATGQPLAKATNAARAQLAATSFEPGAAGRWGYDAHLGAGQHLVADQGYTGRWAYRLDRDGALSRDSLPAGDYDLSLWYQGSVAPVVRDRTGRLASPAPVPGATVGAWHSAQLRLHVANDGYLRLEAPTAAAAILLDEVRLRPVMAQLSTYTYDALRGMTSQTGPDGRAVFYEYDGLGRLVRTRDEQGRILSQQQYHYAGGR